MKRWLYTGIIILGCYLVTSAGIVQNNSTFETEQLKIRYNLVSATPHAKIISFSQNETSPFGGTTDGHQTKSASKAFLLSLAVPGLGQYYNGSKIKPFIFLSIEATSWAYYFKWDGEGNDLTDDFEAFNRTNWSQQRYEDYLGWNYGGITDDDLIDASEVSHHLPDTRTQQYYEMTGKYDQFAWGWADADLDGSLWGDFNSSNPPPKITGSATAPYSDMRESYETMRNEANNSFNKARKMILVSLMNRVVSAFEAMIASNKINKKQEPKGEFSSKQKPTLKFNAKLRSVYAKRDTPYVSFKYKF